MGKSRWGQYLKNQYEHCRNKYVNSSAYFTMKQVFKRIKDLIHVIFASKSISVFCHPGKRKGNTEDFQDIASFATTVAWTSKTWTTTTASTTATTTTATASRKSCHSLLTSRAGQKFARVSNFFPRDGATTKTSLRLASGFEGRGFRVAWRLSYTWSSTPCLSSSSIRR